MGTGLGRRVTAPRAWVLAAAAAILAGCGGSGDYAQSPDDAAPTARTRDYKDPNLSIFGEGGLSFGSTLTDDDLSGAFGGGGALPVNRYLWQAALETLSFLPLASTDPFTGVIATDWGSNPDAPGERFKVTAFMTSSALEAASLSVAIYREIRNDDGIWLPAAVDPATATQIEDAILTRARQIRIADVSGGSTG